MLVQDGSGKHGCGRCAQAEELLHMVVELQEEMGRLRSIKESKNEIDCWGRVLPSMRQGP